MEKLVKRKILEQNWPLDPVVEKFDIKKGDSGYVLLLDLQRRKIIEDASGTDRCGRDHIGQLAKEMVELDKLEGSLPSKWLNASEDIARNIYSRHLRLVEKIADDKRKENKIN
ncbi:hypothetical protein ABK905_07710 [Acerihabitans sp. KWT182]|uniref:Uncharacterized protein n=1 Tax=Acerihabitans sp. KWT182 TaxID=3157919 RepID=A0AAU7QD79_9GAMM